MTAQKQLISVAAFVVLLLGLARPAVAANWTTEPVPAGPGALGPARLSFDAQGRGLLLLNGVPTAAQPRFTGMATRAPGGGWTRLANLRGVGWGNAQALQYATTRVLFVSGQVASTGAFNRAKLRLVAAFGRSDGTGLGSWQTLAPSETGFVAAANHAGQAIVLFDAGGHGLSAIERPAGGRFGRATRVSSAGAFTPAAAINARGDRIVAWIRAGRIEARVRNAGRGWGSVLNVAKAPGVANTSLRAAVDRGRQLHPGVGRSRHPGEPADAADRGHRPTAARVGLARVPAGERDARHERRLRRGERVGGPARDRQRRHRHHVDRRGARQHPGGRQGRPAHEQGPAGRPSRIGRHGECRRRRRRGGAERPGRDRVVAGRRPEPHLHLRRAVTRAGRPVRGPRPAHARRRHRDQRTGRGVPDWYPGSRSRSSRSSRAAAAASFPRYGRRSARGERMRHDSRHGRDEGPDRAR